MGMYDMFNVPGSDNQVQLKNGPCNMDVYNVGDDVSLEDGVYLANNGVVVIINRKYVAFFSHLIDKWGGLLDAGAIIWDKNPIVQVLADLREGDFNIIKQQLKKLKRNLLESKTGSGGSETG